MSSVTDRIFNEQTPGHLLADIHARRRSWRASSEPNLFRPRPLGLRHSQRAPSTHRASLLSLDQVHGGRALGGALGSFPSSCKRSHLATPKRRLHPRRASRSSQPELHLYPERLFDRDAVLAWRLRHHECCESNLSLPPHRSSRGAERCFTIGKQLPCRKNTILTPLPQVMHLHDETLWPSELTETETQARRRLVLFAYQHSVYIAIITGTPLQLRERQINVHEPDEIDDEILLAVEEGVRDAASIPEGRDSWMHGWNKATDLYREHSIEECLQRRWWLTPFPPCAPFPCPPHCSQSALGRNTGARRRPTARLARLSPQHLHRPAHHQNRQLGLHLPPLPTLRRPTAMGSHLLRHHS